MALLIVFFSLFAPPPVHGQKFTVLYRFRGLPITGNGDGVSPQTLVRDAAGNLYGTTYAGGTNAPLCQPYGCGTVFKLNASGGETILHRFKGPDGAGPNGGIIRDAAGNLFGTSQMGGEYSSGTVFKVDTASAESVLYSFHGTQGTGGDGSGPIGLVRDTNGNLYGTTPYIPTVFQLDAAGNETVLYRFTGGADGAYPEAPMIRDTEGNLYGTTLSGGDLSCSFRGGCGTVFKLDPTGTQTVLYSFTGAADGFWPTGRLIRDVAGNFYGTTGHGGGVSCPQNPDVGCGTIFKLDNSGNETVLWRFTGGSDGAYPFSGVVRDAAGNLYGTAVAGGRSGCGTVFKLDTAGNFTVLHTFSGGRDGGSPGELIRDTVGNLYGITGGGGVGEGYGVVFKLTR